MLSRLKEHSSRFFEVNLRKTHEGFSNVFASCLNFLILALPSGTDESGHVLPPDWMLKRIAWTLPFRIAFFKAL
jgi:hypothetical protein